MLKNINKKLVVPAIISFGIYLFSYYLPKFIVDINDAHYLMFDIDSRIKVFSPFVIIYILAYLQWITTLIRICKQETKFGYYALTALVVSSLIGMIIFIVYPTAITRDELIINNIFDYLLNIIYNSDSLINAMPSFHCMWSWYSFRILKQTKKENKYSDFINLIFSLLVFASTQFTKQHYIIDIPTGILLAEIGIFISKKIYHR